MRKSSYRELVAQNRKLRQQLAAARDENSALRSENADLRQENAALRKQVAKLQTALETAERQAKRQSAPFSKGSPKAEPKKPGRKPGRRYGQNGRRPPPPPDKIDECYDVPLPECCPNCSSHDVEETHVAVQYQTEIPRRPIYRQFNIHFGRCKKCGKAVHGRHDLQTSDVVGAAASQLGPAAHAAMAMLNKELGLSHGKVKRCFEILFGIPVARATSAHSVKRTARRCEPPYQEIRAAIRASPWVVPDETGWRVGGRKAWLHVHVGETATHYEIAPGRGSDVIERLLGRDWSGVLIHDGWRPYDVFTNARHQQCLNHPQRRCFNILETAVGGAVRFPRQVLELSQTAFAIRDDYQRGHLNEDQMAIKGLAPACALERLVQGRFTYEPNRRLAKHLANYIWNWFWFLFEPGIDATNWRAEQAIRPGVVNRKVWGGNRTWDSGAKSQSVIMSVLRTITQRGYDPFRCLMRILCSPLPLPLVSLIGAER